MEFIRKTFLSRLWAFTAILCMAATLNAAFVSVQSDLAILDHLNSGDPSASDGGWSAPCNGHVDGCTGHIEVQALTDEPGGSNQDHHHHFNETNSGTVADTQAAVLPPVSASIILWPGASHRLPDNSAATIDQPPRVLSLA